MLGICFIQVLDADRNPSRRQTKYKRLEDVSQFSTSKTPRGGTSRSRVMSVGTPFFPKKKKCLLHSGLYTGGIQIIQVSACNL